MGFFTTRTLTTQKRALPTISQCGKCGLYKGCKSPKMRPSGRGKHKILFVGEAPGENEDAGGRQFVGDAGKWLRDALADLGMDMDDCWITNSAICRPPKNVIDDLYIESCRPNLTNTIAELKPRVIVLLGLSAVKSLMPLEWSGDIGLLGKWVGWSIPSAKWGAWLCPTYHPSYVVRCGEDKALVRIVKEHLRRALELESHTPLAITLPRVLDEVAVAKNEAETIGRLVELSRMEGRLAWDYETTGLKPDREEQEIYSAAFCFEGRHTWAGLITPACYPALSAVLQNPDLKKIASNMKFEERWTLAKLGHPVAGWLHDTMLAAHVLDNRSGITGLKFQAYVNLGIGDYSSDRSLGIEDALKAPTANGLNKIKALSVHDVLKYNGADAFLEYHLAILQRKAMGL